MSAPVTHVVICDRDPTMVDSATLRDLVVARGVPATIVDWDTLRFESLRVGMPGVDADPAGVAVYPVAKVWTRDAGTELLHLFNEVRALGHMGYQVAIRDLTYLDKWLAGCRFAQLGLPTPPTWLVTDVHQVSDLYRERGPVLVKPRIGRQSLGQVRVEGDKVRFNDDGVLIGLLESAVWESLHRYGALVCQDLIAPARELRLQVVGDRLVSAQELVDGPKYQAFTADSELEAIALAAVRALGWPYGELDVLGSGGTYHLIEVNPVINADPYQRVSDLADPLEALAAVADLLVAGPAGRAGG